ncbi:MAG: alanine dehydrogenase [Gammaproteobacteria bacterium]
MLIGIPTEIKPQEGRVGLIPSACDELIRSGHKVFLQSGAGEISGYPDSEYAALGVEIVPDARDVYALGELIVKVKEPVAPELDLLRPDHMLFSFLHLAANRDLLQRLMQIGLTAIAFETVQDHGGLPILAPMSDIAGRLALHHGVNLLFHSQGGRGMLLGGIPGTERGHVVVIGAGNAGSNAVRVAAQIGARVTVFDKQYEKLASMSAIGSNVTALYPFPIKVAEAVADADILVGAVLVPGAKAPHLVSADQVESMRPGSVIVDIAVDQGGCIETTRATTYVAPTYKHAGVTHFCVTNIPGAVPRTASQALSTALIPYVQRLAAGGMASNKALQAGINVADGHIVHAALKGLYPDE